MGKIILIFLVLLFGGCSQIDYPDGFVKQINFKQEIIDVEKMKISSKDELIKLVDISSLITDIYRLRVSTTGLENIPIDYDYVIYIEPLLNEKAILDKNVYEIGMPIVSMKAYEYINLVSKQQVILIKGKPEWADSSYKGFTILPIANSGDDGDWDFTYTIRKIKS